MKKSGRIAILSLLVLLIGIGGIMFMVTQASNEFLVYKGEPRAVIVRQLGNIGQEAIEELRARIQASTGALLPVVQMDSPEERAVPESHVRILIGPGPLTEAAGVRGGDLEQEAYRVVAGDSRLILTGANAEAIVYAVSYYLDEYVGVRYLWPGELGTYVPQNDTLVLPVADVTRRPQEEQRRLRAADTGPKWRAG